MLSSTNQEKKRERETSAPLDSSHQPHKLRQLTFLNLQLEHLSYPRHDCLHHLQDDTNNSIIKISRENKLTENNVALLVETEKFVLGT